MLVFIILSFLLLLGSLIKPRWQNTFLVLSFIILFVLMAYRGLSVGTDTYNYESRFLYIYSGGDWSFLEDDEPLWTLLNKIVVVLGGDFRDLLVASSLILLLPIFFIAKKYSKNPMLTVFLYYTLYIYFYAFNITRQSVAVCLTLLGLVWLIQRRKLLYLLNILVAAQFHTSAYIMLPVIFIDKLSVNNFHIIISLITSIIIGLIGTPLIFRFIEYIDYGTYAVEGQLGSIFVNFLGILLYNSLFIYILFSIRKKDINFKIFYLFIILFNVVSRIPYGNRLLLYLAIYQILFFPYYLYNLKYDSENFKIVTSLLIVFISYFMFFRLYGGGEIEPYINILF